MNNVIFQDPNRVTPRWEALDLVNSFYHSEPQPSLIDYALNYRDALGGKQNLEVLDIGTGAGRNAIPLACLGFQLSCVDLSEPMVTAARRKAEFEAPSGSVHVFKSPMAPLPFPDSNFDLIIAQGVWNLAKSDHEFRRALAEASRVAKIGAGLFVFTFSRHTLPDLANPLPGEKHIFTQFADEPQCFLRKEELLGELAEVGFELNPTSTLKEHNLPPPPYNTVQDIPVIFEATFTKVR